MGSFLKLYESNQLGFSMNNKNFIIVHRSVYIKITS